MRSTPGPVSTRSDCRGGKPASQAFYRQFKRRPRGRVAFSHFCYDVDVWKRQAARVGAQFVRHIVPAFIRPARTLWNEVIGFLFLCFGGIFGIHTVRYAIQGETGRLLVAAFCTLLMAWYGISSFRRARKISRS